MNHSGLSCDPRFKKTTRKLSRPTFNTKSDLCSPIALKKFYNDSCLRFKNLEISDYTNVYEILGPRAENNNPKQKPNNGRRNRQECSGYDTDYSVFRLSGIKENIHSGNAKCAPTTTELSGQAKKHSKFFGIFHKRKSVAENSNAGTDLEELVAENKLNKSAICDDLYAVLVKDVSALKNYRKKEVEKINNHGVTIQNVEKPQTPKHDECSSYESEDDFRKFLDESLSFEHNRHSSPRGKSKNYYKIFNDYVREKEHSKGRSIDGDYDYEISFKDLSKINSVYNTESLRATAVDDFDYPDDSGDDASMKCECRETLSAIFQAVDPGTKGGAVLKVDAKPAKKKSSCCAKCKRKKSPKPVKVSSDTSLKQQPKEEKKPKKQEPPEDDQIRNYCAENASQTTLQEVQKSERPPIVAEKIPRESLKKIVEEDEVKSDLCKDSNRSDLLTVEKDNKKYGSIGEVKSVLDVEPYTTANLDDVFSRRKEPVKVAEDCDPKLKQEDKTEPIKVRQDCDPNLVIRKYEEGAPLKKKPSCFKQKKVDISTSYQLPKKRSGEHRNQPKEVCDAKTCPAKAYPRRKLSFEKVETEVNSQNFDKNSDHKKPSKLEDLPKLVSTGTQYTVEPIPVPKNKSRKTAETEFLKSTGYTGEESYLGKPDSPKQVENDRMVKLSVDSTDSRNRNKPKNLKFDEPGTKHDPVFCEKCNQNCCDICKQRITGKPAAQNICDKLKKWGRTTSDTLMQKKKCKICNRAMGQSSCTDAPIKSKLSERGSPRIFKKYMNVDESGGKAKPKDENAGANWHNYYGDKNTVCPAFEKCTQGAKPKKLKEKLRQCRTPDAAITMEDGVNICAVKINIVDRNKFITDEKKAKNIFQSLFYTYHSPQVSRMKLSTIWPIRVFTKRKKKQS